MRPTLAAAHSTSNLQLFDTPRLNPPRLTDAQREYEALLLASEIKFEDDRQLLAANGWLSPDGKLFSCPYRHHSYLTVNLGHNSEADLEQIGWIKLSQNRFLLNSRYAEIVITPEQQETIAAWHASNELSTEYFDEQAKSL